MSMRKIRSGDEVIVICGKDKGRRGKVLRVEEDRVVVEGVSIVKKHVRPNPQANQTGGILDREASIHVSNVALYNSSSKKGSSVGFKLLEDSRKVRIFKDTGDVVDI